MISQSYRQKKRQARHRRVRMKIAGSASRPRLSIFRSNRYLYVQLIDDLAGRTLVSVSNLGRTSSARPVADEARVLGEALAAKAKTKKIKSVVFDRGGYRYAGKIKALADGARAGGLIF